MSEKQKIKCQCGKETNANKLEICPHCGRLLKKTYHKPKKDKTVLKKLS